MSLKLYFLLTRSVLLLFLSGISFSSCKYLVSKYYGANKPLNFKSRKAYSEYLVGKKKFDPSNLIYPDSTNWFDFLDFISRNEISVYFGCLLNDSTELKKSNKLTENFSCMGRVLGEIHTNTLQYSSYDSSLLTKSNFKNLRFREFLTNKKFELNHSEKPLKIILIYSYSFGRLFDKLFDSVYSFHINHNNETQLYIITLDNIFQLK